MPTHYIFSLLDHIIEVLADRSPWSSKFQRTLKDPNEKMTLSPADVGELAF